MRQQIYVVKPADEHIFIRIGKKLGESGFSKVYQIEDVAGPQIKGLGDSVLKISAITTKNDVDDSSSREQEAADLKLPHVVLTYASHSFEADGKTHLIMWQQALKGGDFEGLLKSEDTPIELKIEALRQFAEGEKELQDNHIYHKDIKPANAMLPEEVGPESQISDVNVRVIDFGIHRNLKKYDNLKNSLAWSGTLNYASPELVALQSYQTPMMYNERLEEYKVALQAI